MEQEKASLTGTIVAWLAAFVMFFPILWMVITAFKTEEQAIAIPPLLLFRPVLSSFGAALAQSGYIHFAENSLIVSLCSTALAVLIAFPAAYAMAFQPGKRTQDLLVWMLSTKMLPPVGVLVPIYLIFRDTDLLDTRTSLVIVDALINLPIVIWMLFSFFRDIPRDILEAAHMDGVGPRGQMIHLLLPLAAPGIASAALLAIILSWNEAFWSINLTAAHAGTLATFIARYSAPEGLFWAKLSAASVLAVAPILIFGSLAQRRMVRGLTVGAVK
ncbi:MAG TPA: carbohydrate ABC transporter permease [Acetobacteraceae bacterium]|jgi:sorbitol/mannitol transport system permease protein|nr:carbohydrate ABC transporter permease [Acetobacteraceae bacterium]